MNRINWRSGLEGGLMESERDDSEPELTTASPEVSSSLEESGFFHEPSQKDDMAAAPKIIESVRECVEDEEGD